MVRKLQKAPLGPIATLRFPKRRARLPPHRRLGLILPSRNSMSPRGTAFRKRRRLIFCRGHLRGALGMREATGSWAFAALAVLLSLAFSTPAAAEKRVALVIGNSAYQNVTRLDNPRNDATLMAETLSRSRLHPDRRPRPARSRQGRRIDTAVQSFGRQVQGADVALFYYAGHGVQVARLELSGAGQRQSDPRSRRRFPDGGRQSRAAADAGLRHAAQHGDPRRLP